MSSSASRKRPAGVASAVPPGSIQPQSPTYATPDQMMRWNGVAAQGNTYNDVSGVYAGIPQQHDPVTNYQAYEVQPQSQPRPQNSTQIPPSNMVARRPDNASRALVTSRSGFDGQAEQWPTSENALVPALNARSTDPEEQLLIEAVAKAQKIAEEANGDRAGNHPKRSIPPFVLKLATFLNRGTNQDLIRWSDKGDSFLVLDEDEFARSLIPQLFKHANYASFVRQLNMYGFHKRVGLADNSMRASEKKNKSPSEYAHPYFRRGYDVLQWLIQKPNKSKGDKRKGGGKRDATEAFEFDSDDEYDDAQGFTVSGGAPGRLGPLAKTEMTKFREQLAEIQTKQQQTLAMIQSLRAGQEQIMQKAHRVEVQHQRHENSITAILNFLANVFRKSLEGKSGAENLTEMLASILPMAGQGAGIPTGSVQDLGDMSGLGDFGQQQNVSERTSLSPVPRHRQHLLPGIPANGTSAGTGTGTDKPVGNTVKKSSSSRSGTPVHSSGYQAPSVSQGPQQTDRITEVFDTSPDDTTSPNEYYRNELEVNPQEAIMRLMGATNARMNSGVDLPEAAANTSASMPIDQRRRMLHSMSQRAASQNDIRTNTPQPPAQQPSVPSTGQTHTPQAPAVTPPSYNNAVAPVSNTLFEQPALPADTSLLIDADQAQHQFQQIEEQQHDVEEGISDLARFAAQLSPNGHIPGFDGAVADEDYFGNSLADSNNFNASYNPDDWLNAEPDFGDPVNFDFSVGGAQQFNGEFHGPGGDDGALGADLSATLKTNDTPSPALTEEIERDDLAGGEMPAAKRARAK
ncbi:Heat shock transcription factor [Gnomoniopsis sp. IMI 355080]|nr:Heat shock transcription factor [Gnomoniopsis sp. IMI 355080]